jgi:hypothetical protein
MNLVEVKEFAKLAKLESKQISVYLQRKKIIPEKIIGEGRGRKVLLDTDHPINKEFILSHQMYAAKKELLGVDSADEVSIMINDDLTDEDKPEGYNVTNSPSNYELDRLLKEAELTLKKQKEQINRILIEKAEGRLVPTDVVGRFTSEVIHRYKSTMVQQIDQLIRDYFNTNQIDSKQLTEALSKLIQIANDASHRAVTEAKIAVENSITDSLSLSK